MLAAIVGSASNPVIPDSAITASSTRSDAFAAKNIRVGSVTGWAHRRSLPHDRSSWIQFDFGRRILVHGFQTRADGNYDCWISLLNVSHSLDGKTWTWHPKAFSGNNDNSTLKDNILLPCVNCRFIRLHPIEVNGPGHEAWPCTLQAELLGCEESLLPRGCEGSSLPRAEHCISMLHQLWQAQEFTDCKVTCHSKVYACHRSVLVNASPVWRAALKGNFREAREAKIDIEEADEEAVGALLKYIYTAELDSRHAEAVLPLAHRYELAELVGLCAACMFEKLTKDNVVQVLSSLNPFLEHERIAAIWPSVVKKVSADAGLQDAAMRCVRRRTSS